jgi:hypothetical protein
MILVERHPKRRAEKRQVTNAFRTTQTLLVRAERLDMPILFSVAEEVRHRTLSSEQNSCIVIFSRSMGTSHVHNAFKIIREASIGGAFLLSGTIAAGFLFREHDMARALLLSGIAFCGAAGGFYFFFRMLRVISPKNKPVFIATLQ